MRYLTIKPDAVSLSKLGFDSVAHVPFLIREDGFYPPEANRYIRARALLELELKLGTRDRADDLKQPQTKRRKSFLSVPSIQAVAEKIAHFLRWCEQNKKDWRAIDYVSDVMQWQRQLLAGTGSASRKPLGPERVNGLVNEACYFLTWASETPSGEAGGTLRPALYIPVTDVLVSIPSQGTDSSAPKKQLKEARAGSLPSRPLDLTLPTPAEVRPWLRAMQARFAVKGLMAETVTSTGLRISEVNEMRPDTLPARADWRRRMADGQLLVRITHGIKGPKESPLSKKSVRPRDVPFPLELAEKIDHYRSVTRPNQLRNWISAPECRHERERRRRAPKPERLWLSEWSNQPFANKQFYVAWTTAPHCPPDWHPHAGREYFAVETVVAWIRRDLMARGSTQAPELTWLIGAMRDQVRLLLTPIMGHVSDETTRVYLRHAHRRLIEEFGHPSLAWTQHTERGNRDE